MDRFNIEKVTNDKSMPLFERRDKSENEIYKDKKRICEKTLLFWRELGIIYTLFERDNFWKIDFNPE